MELIDLHVHSNISDGTLSPLEVVALAAVKGLRAVALTDHDTVDGVSEAMAAAATTSLEVVPGTELSCLYRGREIHMLGLYVDYGSQKLLASLAFLKEARERRNLEILNRFRQDGFLIEDMDLAEPGQTSVITRAHFARALLKRGYVSSMEQAFKRYLDYGKKYCPPKEVFSPGEAIRLILEAGGFPALAHPILYKLGWRGTEDLVADLKKEGLMGVEVYYSSHTANESAQLRELCRAYDLLPTGGSDFHGAVKPDIELGTGRGGLRVSYPLLLGIKNALVDQRNQEAPPDGAR